MDISILLRGRTYIGGRASDSRQREPGLNLVVGCQTLGQFITLLQFTQLYLAIDNGGYLHELPSRINCSMAGCFRKKVRWYLIEQVCQA